MYVSKATRSVTLVYYRAETIIRRTKLENREQGFTYICRCASRLCALTIEEICPHTVEISSARQLHRPCFRIRGPGNIYVSARLVSYVEESSFLFKDHTEPSVLPFRSRSGSLSTWPQSVPRPLEEQRLSQQAVQHLPKVCHAAHLTVA